MQVQVNCYWSSMPLMDDLVRKVQILQRMDSFID